MAGGKRSIAGRRRRARDTGQRFDRTGELVHDHRAETRIGLETYRAALDRDGLDMGLRSRVSSGRGAWLHRVTWTASLQTPGNAARSELRHRRPCRPVATPA